VRAFLRVEASRKQHDRDDRPMVAFGHGGIVCGRLSDARLAMCAPRGVNGLAGKRSFRPAKDPQARHEGVKGRRAA
jgi:hypothetical protein